MKNCFTYTLSRYVLAKVSARHSAVTSYSARIMIPVPDYVDFRQELAGKSSFPAGKLRKMVGRWKQ
jgi:hypothetical protein